MHILKIEIHFVHLYMSRVITGTLNDGTTTLFLTGSTSFEVEDYRFFEPMSVN